MCVCVGEVCTNLPAPVPPVLTTRRCRVFEGPPHGVCVCVCVCWGGVYQPAGPSSSRVNNTAMSCV